MGSEAGEAASDKCDWTACNGFTLKINIFEKELTYGQCQHPAGNDGSEDDFFCFVNADSNCADKVICYSIYSVSHVINYTLLAFSWKSG